MLISINLTENQKISKIFGMQISISKRF